jgi:hypothetical protein
MVGMTLLEKPYHQEALTVPMDPSITFPGNTHARGTNMDDSTTHGDRVAMKTESVYREEPQGKRVKGHQEKARHP